MVGSAVDVIPIGGVGQFGMNCTLLRAGDEVAVVDAGMMFPPGDFWGVDAVVPDLGSFLSGGTRVVAIVLTHGHDDHIGGAAHLMDQTQCPVYGSDLTLGFLRDRLEDRDRGDGPAGAAATRPRDRLVRVRARDRVRAGPFGFEFVHVTHSVPGSFSLVIDTPAGTIVHSADLKLDPTPVDGETTDLDAFRARGREGVRMLLLDSTNAGREGTTPSEREVGAAFARTLAEAVHHRLFVTTFSSHVHRVQQFIDGAVLAGRKVAIVGRRMNSSLRTARETGRLHVPPLALVRAEEAMDLPPERCLFIAGGSQGEPGSAMSRISRALHPRVRIERGDVVVHSARPIPGNEVPIGRMLDDLARRGAHLIAGAASGLHVSGHGSRDDLAALIDAVRPETLVPIHGTYRHLLDCARLAETVPHPVSSILIVENGDIIHLDGSGARVRGRMDVRPVLVDRENDRVDEEVLKERRQLAADGILLLLIVVDRASGRLLSRPDVLARGFAAPSENGDLLREAARLAEEAARASGSPAGAEPTLAENLTVVVRRFVRRRTGKKPLVAPIVVEI